MVPRTLLHLLIFVYLVVADKTCYFPSGDVAIDDVPCFSGDADSPCCSKNSLCLTNGFCYGLSQPYTLSRGSCTNKNWPANGACDDKCSGATERRNSGCALPLYRYIDKEPYYCADSVTVNSTGDTACLAGSPFALGNAELITDKAALANYTFSDTGSNSTSNSNTTLSSDAKKDNDVAIGAGVGVPLGVLLLTALIWALFERRKRLSVQAMVEGLQSQVAETAAYRNMQGQTPLYSPPSELSAYKPPQELETTH
ncbi:hypothetical protein N7489_010011 [Penicillium chrysogenum]|uniref:Uncharacterized protein n=1 Tax=Penicillium chrysogenum TaxID=5076 RepID=A0ABQ8WVP4_PENCH|nr:uncharacterized protein N7489_010011 [Penicillium chrysogenum]KAJ5229303.1 hypothetical protein N7489_010011 [Penicillium chrysogenum]KAJ5282817.1 hypothetical protein N7505_000797 [Penicillium chrysogenum]KAJ6169178.1 hypothetical protein N7497_002021 [Penicillium chrysogenum]